ncbi:MAG: sigma-70 family RNA polymerase sigma factor [Deltaproteobacteria bacterium]|nr:sigma-70 family RNA polymerase sigma factor [Deltaproteobacteria bacterium]
MRTHDHSPLTETQLADKTQTTPNTERPASEAQKLSPVAMHPLRAVRKPGPRGMDEPDEAEQDLMRASQVLELIEKGLLEKGEPLAPLSIPVDIIGRPKRRLTTEDERELSFRIQTFGDIEARNILVLANLGLVHLLSNQMRRPHVRYDDLVQEGTLGLLRATETFEPDRGVRFSTYCVYWIRAKLQRFLQKLDRDDTPVVNGAKMQENEKGQRIRPRSRKLSFDGPIDDEEDRTLGDSIKANTFDPEEVSLKEEVKERVGHVLLDIAAELQDERLIPIIEQRLLAEEPKTLAQLGELLSLSREGARLLENKLLRLAKERLRDLSPFDKDIAN